LAQIGHLRLISAKTWFITRATTNPVNGNNSLRFNDMACLVLFLAFGHPVALNKLAQEKG
jgi:hypothetical protein